MKEYSNMLQYTVCHFTRPPAVRIKYQFLRPQLRSMSHTPPPLCPFSTFWFLFVIASRVFVVDQFGIRRWKTNEKKNLLISKHLKIGRRGIAYYVRTNLNYEEKPCVCTIQYVHSNHHILLLTSRGLACKVRKLVLSE